MKLFTLLLCSLLVSVSVLSKNKTWEIIDSKGNVTGSIEAMNVREFSNGLAIVYKNTLVNNKWITGYGFINSKAEIVIPAIYKNAYPFKKGDVTWVKKDGESHFTLITKSGQTIPTKKYEKVGFFFGENEDISAVYENGRMGFINSQGREIIPCDYTGSAAFHHGLVSVAKYDGDGKYGYLNTSGEIAIPFNSAQGGFSGFNAFKISRAKSGGKTVLINTKGETIFSTSKGTIAAADSARVLIYTKSNRSGWGYIDYKQNAITDFSFDHIQFYSESGYSIVERDGLRGVIDYDGKLVLPMVYETVYADPTEDGFFMGVYPSEETKSLLDSKKDYFTPELQKLDLKGKKYIYHAKGGELMIYIDANNKKGYVNRDFEIVIPARYEKASAFSEGYASVRVQ